jgi:hypothetical protein
MKYFSDYNIQNKTYIQVTRGIYKGWKGYISKYFKDIYICKIYNEKGLCKRMKARKDDIIHINQKIYDYIDNNNN